MFPSAGSSKRGTTPLSPGWDLLTHTGSQDSDNARLEASFPASSISTPHVIDPSFEMPANVPGLTKILGEISARQDIPRTAQIQLATRLVTNFTAALEAGRAPDKVTILLLGDAGQGKSKTINKLVGKYGFLKTGRLESTTKEIQSVQVPVVRDGVKFTLAWDDTPGLYDTTFADREKNALIFNHYCQSFSHTGNSENVLNLTRLLDSMPLTLPRQSPPLRPPVFPNAILLINSWRDIKRDLQDEPGRFTSSLGRAVWAMKNSGLYDEARPNVIVVVTKSLADPIAQLEECRGSPGFDREWSEQAQIKREIVHELQESVFPGSIPWPIVFVENGANKREFSTYDILPNGQRSHQNLIDELKSLFGQEEGARGGQDAPRDLLGLHSLADAQAGLPNREGDNLEIVIRAIREVDDGVSGAEKRMALRRFGGGGEIAVSVAVDLLASKVLGHAYNPILDRISSMSIVDSKVRISVSSAECEGFDGVARVAGSTLDGEGGSHSKSSLIRAHKIVAKASLDNTLPPLSPSVTEVIEALPPWSDVSLAVRSSYYDFFEKYGTHVIVSAALGGAVYIGGRKGTSLDTGVAERTLQHGETPSLIPARPRASSGELAYQGGRKAGPSLIQSLRDLISPTSSTRPAPKDWLSERSRWVDDLIDDPSFLSGVPETVLGSFDALPGLSQEQQRDLHHATNSYLMASKNSNLDRLSGIAFLRKMLKKGWRILHSLITGQGGRSDIR